MTDQPRSDQIVTPEAVSLTVDAAGIGSRMIAAAIDTVIQLAILLAFLFVFAGGARVEGGGGVAVLIAVVFIIVWGYYPLFEGLNAGRTPGKRAQKIRVTRADGQPASLGPILVRNLLRIVDFLPSYYAIGVITMLSTKRSQRLGDLAAGTIVVRDRAAPIPSVAPPVSAGAAVIAPKLDTAGLRERDYDVARSFLQRRTTLDPGARNQLAKQIAQALRQRVPDLAGAYGNNEEFIEATVAAYRDRFAAGDRSQPPPYSPS